jgi:hypothetical protein
MGYYIRITHSNVVIPAENLDASYAALVALNARDDLKSGGAWPGRDDPKPEGADHHPHRWFSWMPADLKTLPTTAAILECLGFELQESEDGTIEIYGYDSKAGDEEIFLLTLAPYIKPNTEIEWMGEENEQWKLVFKNGRMYRYEAEALWNELGEVTL